jgi:hypothetical protein
VRCGGRVATFEAEGTGAWRIERAEVAPRYGSRLEAPRLVASLTGEKCRTVITLRG